MARIAESMTTVGEGGTIINITSRLASIGIPTMSVYSASKGGDARAHHGRRRRTRAFNIRVYAVAPGMTNTPLFAEWVSSQDDPEATMQRVASAIPLRRIAEPADVAGAVSYLASPAAAYVTGVSLPVDGGYLAQ
jgi:NAD(P)-dependent dehydrogenase (short-subunit alcohol dehydrogenase family)